MTRSKNIVSNAETISILKNFKNNMIVTEFPNISEFDLENCLKEILNTNKNLFLYTYDYCKDNQTIYFYSNKKIDLTGYQNFITNKPSTKTSEILKEIRTILTRTKTDDLEMISLYDLFKVINQKRNDFEKTKRSFTNIFEYILNSRCTKKFTVTSCTFDYLNNVLNLSFDLNEKFGWCRSEYLCFSKVNGKMCLSSNKTENSDIILFLLGNHLSQLYDHFMASKDVLTQEDLNIASDSKFVINITQKGIDLCTTAIKDNFKYDFRICLASINGECKRYYNSFGILKLLDGKEKELFEKIFVKIDNCPKYLQEDLYEIRKEELNEKSFLLSIKEKGLKLAKQIMLAKEKIK